MQQVTWHKLKKIIKEDERVVGIIRAAPTLKKIRVERNSVDSLHRIINKEMDYYDINSGQPDLSKSLWWFREGRVNRVQLWSEDECLGTYEICDK